MDDHLRASDADRDHAAEQLRGHYVAGRLTRDEFDERLATALDAVTLGALSNTLSDLPQPAPVRPEAVRLERRYRRLLALYPARYRRVHGEEMLAVLMTSAPEGQDRPGLAGTADLIAGALRVRCQAVLAVRLGWRGAASLTAAGAVLGLLAGVPFASVTPLSTASVTASFPFPMQPVPATGGSTQVDQSTRALMGMTALTSSNQVVARAARTIRPAMSQAALRQRLSISVTAGGSPGVEDTAVAVVTVQMGDVQSARAAARDVADSYIRAVEDAHLIAAGQCGPRSTCSVVVRATKVMPGVPDYAPPPRLNAPAPSDAGQTTALGALIGAFAAAAVALGSRRRRYWTA